MPKLIDLVQVNRLLDQLAAGSRRFSAILENLRPGLLVAGIVTALTEDRGH